MTDWSGLSLHIGAVASVVMSWIKQHPTEVGVALLALVRLFGTTVETGWHGVVFRLGQPQRDLAPGFHMLIPWVEQVKKVRSRSVTLDAQRQRITAADGLVYEVDANLVLRVENPRKALIAVDDFMLGANATLSIAVRDVVGAADGTKLNDWDSLNARLATALEPGLAPWGLVLERAGFTTITPSGVTLRISQLDAKASERQTMLRHLQSQGLPSRTALKLLGATNIPMSHAASRYRTVARAHRRRDSTLPYRFRNLTLQDLEDVIEVVAS